MGGVTCGKIREKDIGRERERERERERGDDLGGFTGAMHPESGAGAPLRALFRDYF
jgi:hypothetical protein